MKRRTFLYATSAFALAPGFAQAEPTGRAWRPGLVEGLLKEGRVVFLDFYTDWCVTCAAQGRVIRRLKSENPAYEESISFVAVDWDRHAGSDIAKRLGVRSRAVLVMLKGDEEIGRLEWETSEEAIRALLDAGLAAASS